MKIQKGFSTILVIIISILVIGGGLYYLNIDFKPCILNINQENKEICYMKKALKTGNYDICSNIKTLYREKRCVDLIKSHNSQTIESVLKSL
jgi:hypothetical protein